MLALGVLFTADLMSHERPKTGNQASPFHAFVRSWQLACARFGRNSLFVYWIHVELVYGYATWPIHNRLPLWGALTACAAFSGVMYAAVLAKDRVRQWRPALAGSGRPPAGLKEAT